MENDLPPESEPRKGFGGKIALAIGVIALAGGAYALTGAGQGPSWSDDGRDRETETEEAKPVTDAAPPQHVAPALPDVDSAVRGIIKSRLEATISSRITAKITAMPYREGQSFARGALLVSFDCSTLRAQLTASNAATAAYRKTYETNVELDAFAAIGKNDVEISKANLAKADAEARAIAAQLTDCAIYAPFAGMVVEKIGHAHEVAASGQPLMKIQNGSELEVELIVPSAWLTWLKPGTPFDFRIDETGDTVKANVTRLGAAVDPVSKTLRITGTIDPAIGIVLPGMSGSAHFAVPAEAAASKVAAAPAGGQHGAAR